MEINLQLSQNIDIADLANDINLSAEHDEDTIFQLIVLLEKGNENFSLLERLHDHFKKEYAKYDED